MLDWHRHCVALNRSWTAEDLELSSHMEPTHKSRAVAMMAFVCIHSWQRANEQDQFKGIKRQQLKCWETLQLTHRTSILKHYTRSVISPSICSHCLEHILEAVEFMPLVTALLAAGMYSMCLHTGIFGFEFYHNLIGVDLLKLFHFFLGGFYVNLWDCWITTANQSITKVQKAVTVYNFSPSRQ